MKELRSVVEIMILHDDDSFHDLAKKSFVNAYHSVDLVKELLEYFEIDLDEFDDGDEKMAESANTVDVESKDILQNEDDDDALSPPLSRWDSIKSKIKEESDTEEKAECDSDKPVTKTPEIKNLVFKREMISQNRSSNPLLSNGRGAYVGRQLGNNFHHDMREVSSEMIIKAKQIRKKSRVIQKAEGNLGARHKSPTDRVHIKEEQEDNPGSMSTQTTNMNTVRNRLYLGSSEKIVRLNIESNKKTNSQKRSSLRSLQGAAVLAARASLALRKKTKN